MKNNNREQIIALFDKAESRIQIAVSWLTDEMLINKLGEAAQNKKVELLLSCDALNVWRYGSIRDLQRKGAKVMKTGTDAPGVKGFMHAKFIIIDGKVAHGGSFNFTDGANYNYENFKEYAVKEVPSLIDDYQDWWSTAKDYTIGFENPDAVKKLVVQSFERQEKFKENLLATIDADQRKFFTEDIDERNALIKGELEKEKIRESTKAMQAAKISIGSNGALQNNSTGVVSKPHKFYGGRLQTKFNGGKKPNSYSYALIQKLEIQKKYSFLKCRIENDTLICRGELNPNGKSYDILIEFRAGTFPQVYILSPIIVPKADIHIYSEGSLCLFYPGDLRWKDNTSIAEYTIPWIIEWILFYELYQLSGVWEGESVAHGKINNIAIK
ncbi:MAG: phospholipase D-like domain-containing protein [Leadbetterella sp.]|nr:phospholipase D-like domain-containing protein [Leadbetterella sp.]